MQELSLTDRNAVHVRIAVLQELSTYKNCVIATGGGAVTKCAPPPRLASTVCQGSTVACC